MDSDSVENAIAFVEYFRKQGIQVHNFLCDTDLNEKQKLFVEALPSSFETNVALQIANQCGISRPTLYRFLKDSHLFIKNDHGIYSKKT